MRTLILLAGHPYFDLVQPELFLNRKRWKVRWRDFETVAQDAEFSDEATARAFIETLCKPPLIWEINNDMATSADQYWKDLAAFRNRVSGCG